MHALILNANQSPLIRKALERLFLDKQYYSLMNVANAQGNTPLHLAAIMGFDNLVDFMIKNGADPTLKNNYQMDVQTETDNVPSFKFTETILDITEAAPESIQRVTAS